MAYIKKYKLSDAFLRQRRNIVLSSIGLICFYIAQGKFSNTQSFMMGIEFEKPEIFLVFAWLAWFYFIWRFYLYSDTAVEKYVSCYLTEFKKANMHSFCLDIIKDHYKENSGKRGLSENYFKQIQQGCFPKISLYYMGFILDFSIDRSRFIFTQIQKMDRHARNVQDIERVQILVPFYNKKFFNLALGVSLVFLRAIFKQQGFSDLIVPSLLILAALFTGLNYEAEILTCIAHGS